jgi:two-component system, OmpR family, alkaline phosphatase synthesis response regulator PhoP
VPSTIMVVEDDEELNDILHYNLTRAGYHVVQAWDGRQAVEAVRREPPDLVLLDIMLPETDGWEVCRFLADAPDRQRIPIIIFTAKSAREDFDQARQFNLAGFFTKPYATADVLRHVEKVLATSGDRLF